MGILYGFISSRGSADKYRVLSAQQLALTLAAAASAIIAAVAVAAASSAPEAEAAGIRSLTDLPRVSCADVDTADALSLSDTGERVLAGMGSELSKVSIIAGTSGSDAVPADIGGELTCPEEGDIEQALPANVRLDRITIDAELTLPLKHARVSSVFGFRKNPVTGRYTFHKGLDLAAPSGTEIHAMYPGRVTLASWDNGYGNYIILDHGGYQTLYAHCSRLLRSEGDKVGAGDVIALVGSTGNSTGSHLHVEIRRGGQRYDPEWILGGIYS